MGKLDSSINALEAHHHFLPLGVQLIPILMDQSVNLAWHYGERDTCDWRSIHLRRFHLAADGSSVIGYATQDGPPSLKSSTSLVIGKLQGAGPLQSKN